ncbi:MAG: hypothetical protein HQL51_08860 [Magnetococcales bacterium]|nr:hypothetical protein [Magnetococcales bacterium]
MPRQSPVQTNFTAGELSPRLLGRVDQAKYANGCQVMENFIPMVHGGVITRPGTHFVAGVKDHTRKVRLIPFEFSTTQAYVLEFGHLYIRFYMNGGQIMSGNNPYEVVSPWSESELFDLQFAQSADVMWVVHRSHKPRKISRAAHDSWSIANYAPTMDPFTDGAEYPGAVTFFQQRIWFGGTLGHPQKLWASKSGDYFDMTTGTSDSHALEYEIASGKVNAIQWLSSGRDLLIGTAGAEFRASGGNKGAITPSNVEIRPQTSHGCARVMPVQRGESTLFLQRAGRKIRQLSYALETDGYQAPDLSLYAEHITEGGVVQLDFQQEPDSVVWMVRADGTLLGMTYEKGQEVVGWHRHILGGQESAVESVTVIPSNGVGGDEVWLVARRTINGATKRYVEQLDSGWWLHQDDCYYVDSGLSLDASEAITGLTKASPVVATCNYHGFSNGDSIRITRVEGMTEVNDRTYVIGGVTTHTFQLTGVDGTEFGTYLRGGLAAKAVLTVSGLSHLEGQTVSILADGAEHPPKVVTSGQITLDWRAAKVHVGLGYVSRLLTLPLALMTQTGTALGKMKGWGELTVKLYRSLGGKIQGEELDWRSPGDAMDAPPPLFTGDRKVNALGYDTEAKVEIIQDKPLPLTVLALTGLVDVHDG